MIQNQQIMTITIIFTLLIIGYLGYDYWKNDKSKKETQRRIDETQKRFDELSYQYNTAFKQGDINQIMSAARNLVEFHAVNQNSLNIVYEQSLSLLKKNPDLKPFALEMGRKKYSHFRPNGSPTTYDESAIMNDINAAL